MSAYTVGYICAACLFLINVGIAAIQAAYASGHGADLHIDPTVQAWLAVASTIIAAALGLLPQITRTPAKREAEYLLAVGGRLPDDLRRKYPVTVTGQPGATEEALVTPADPEEL